MALKIVRLTKGYKNLFAGEQAGFEDSEAAYLVSKGGAEYVDLKAAEEKSAAKEAPKK